MKKTNLTRIVTAVLGSGLLLAASCSVDSSDFIFDDDEYGKLNGSGGAVAGDGDGDGDGDLGGQSPTGGMGGEMGTGGGPVNMPGDVRCSGKQIQFFAGGELWAPLGAPCEFLCTDGACTGDCEPKDSSCVSGLETRTCDKNGVWNTSTCDFACIDDQCGGSCVPGSRRCDSKQKQLCSEKGSWENDGVECPSACTASDDGLSAACSGSCTNDDTQCFDIKQRQTCIGNAWTNDATTCQFACLDGECGGTCDPGKSVCSGNSRQTCSTIGSPLPLVHCDGQACVDGSCVGDCQPGAKRCNGANIELCGKAGKWETSEKCDGSFGPTFSCVPYDTGKGVEPICGECTPGTDQPVSRCHTVRNSHVIETCAFADKVTQWKKTDSCSNFCFNSTCFDTVGEACKGERSGTTLCADSSNEWVCRGISKPSLNACEKEGPCEFSACGIPGKSL